MNLPSQTAMLLVYIEHGETRKFASVADSTSETVQQTACIDSLGRTGGQGSWCCTLIITVLQQSGIQYFKIVLVVLVARIAPSSLAFRMGNGCQSRTAICSTA